MPVLHVMQNARKMFCFPLAEGRTLIGRSTLNDVILSGDQVSRQHAVIEKRDGSYWLSDTSSTGTWFNREKLLAPASLHDGHEIMIGDWSLTFRLTSPVEQAESHERLTQITRLTDVQDKAETRILKLEHDGVSLRSLRPLLIIEDAEGGKSHFLIKNKRVVVGGDEDCDIVLKDKFVSKKHLEISPCDGGFRVTDLDSTNGTMVAGASIREMYVCENQEIRLGESRILATFENEREEKITPFAEEKFCGIVGKSQGMRLLFTKIAKVAATDMTALILGDTGAGKEMVARAVHDLSARADKPYIILNGAAISASLIESELFGHERGAFTGADQRRIGAFEQASGGTLFLDEIGELPIELQAKVLRVLEYQNLRRVGGNQDIRVDVRLVTATHRDLATMVALGKFRQDLFYRLYVLPLAVPPLCDRSEDIAPLARHFLREFAADKPPVLEAAALERLMAHDWPGNVRELKNTLLRAMAFCQGLVIRAADIEIISLKSSPTHRRGLDNTGGGVPAPRVSPPTPIARVTDETERDRLVEAIRTAGGDKTRAAKILGMGRSTLFRRIKELGIT